MTDDARAPEASDRAAADADKLNTADLGSAVLGLGLHVNVDHGDDTYPIEI